ncbi:piggyBac transposable element-derived protein 3-like [Leptopilina heterotoma]|uniref:piggyBac transposable element-derived protein 3-like n=1 Tax=Leptopilina heterotoma TaxID=63436 RepID=UPI001CAA3868|nr:piggyBac transposable element-derived protein 3-like [Leptopilina heterotoma]
MWSKDPYLRSDIVASAMSRNKFEKIKSNLKFYKPEVAENTKDRAWRVRSMLNIFRKNLVQFGIFSTAVSIDEMMTTFYGRCVMKQFIKAKPIRFGIKMWALCSASGFLFDFDIYCGKNSDKGEVLTNCALGSRVVLQMLQKLLFNIPAKKLFKYHVYYDNLFCCPDLLVHLKKAGLRATGTVRENRIKEKNDISKDTPRGTFAVKHDKNSV